MKLQSKGQLPVTWVGRHFWNEFQKAFNPYTTNLHSGTLSLDNHKPHLNLFKEHSNDYEIKFDWVSSIRNCQHLEYKRFFNNQTNGFNGFNSKSKVRALTGPSNGPIPAVPYQHINTKQKLISLQYWRLNLQKHLK